VCSGFPAAPCLAVAGKLALSLPKGQRRRQYKFVIASEAQPSAAISEIINYQSKRPLFSQVFYYFSAPKACIYSIAFCVNYLPQKTYLFDKPALLSDNVSC